MPAPWITVNDVLDMVAAEIKVGDRANLIAEWTNHATRALESGHRDLVSILLGKGFTSAQLDGWDYRVSYAKDQCLFWALVYGAGLGGYDDRDVNKLDHRKELIEAATLMINGIPVLPGGTGDANPSVVSGGMNVVGDGTRLATTFGQWFRRNPDGSNQYGDEAYPGEL